jgi:hypothetical protein
LLVLALALPAILAVLQWHSSLSFVPLLFRPSTIGDADGMQSDDLKGRDLLHASAAAYRYGWQH